MNMIKSGKHIEKHFLAEYFYEREEPPSVYQVTVLDRYLKEMWGNPLPG